MAKIPAKKSSKGRPPSPTNTVGNLEKPEPATLVPLNFKVLPEFRQEMKIYAAQQGVSMTKLLIDGFELIKKRGQ
jgi:hypothetical protein